nr:hypothetical protein Cry52Nrm2_p081 [Cryptomonas curvata]
MTKLFNHTINSNKNPIQIFEIIQKSLYEFFVFKKNSQVCHSLIDMKFKIIYKSSEFSELTDSIRQKKFQELLINKIMQNLKNSDIICRLNYFIFPRPVFLFLTELILLISNYDKLIFSFFFFLIDFLSLNGFIKEAFSIIEKIPLNSNKIEIEKLLKTFKKFDIFFLSKNYVKARKLLSSFYTFISKEYLTPEIISEITIRLAKFSIKANKLNSAVSYLIESLFKLEEFNKLRFSILIELLFFCATFIKNFRFTFLPKEFKKLPKNLNFTLIKLSTNVIKKKNIPAIELFLNKIKYNNTKEFMRTFLIKFFDYVFIKKIKSLTKTYLRVPVNCMSVILGVKKKKLKKKIELLILTQKIKCFFDHTSDSFIFFEKKKQPEFLSLLMFILIQLNSMVTFKLRKNYY